MKTLLFTLLICVFVASCSTNLQDETQLQETTITDGTTQATAKYDTDKLKVRRPGNNG